MFVFLFFSIPFEKVCDGIYDCGDSGDERSCGQIKFDPMYTFMHQQNGINNIYFFNYFKFILL